MDVTTIGTPSTVMEAVDVLKKSYLVSEPGGEGLHYICLAAEAAATEGAILYKHARQIKDLVWHKIWPSTSLAAYLHNQGLLPEDCKVKGGYALDNPNYIRLRDEFLDIVKKQLRDTRG